MGTLSYTVTMSLDGYAADANGDFPWTAPGSDVFDFHVERMASVSTEVLGRNTYQTINRPARPLRGGEATMGYAANRGNRVCA